MLTSVKGNLTWCNLTWFKKRTQKLSWGRRKKLTEKRKHPKKLCFPEGFTPLEIPVVATRNRAGHYPPPELL